MRREKERDKSRRATVDSLFLTCLPFIPLVFSVQACFTEKILHIWQAAKDVFGHLESERKSAIDIPV